MTKDRHPWPSSVAHAFAAVVLVASGSCIRGLLLFPVGLPLVVAGFVEASRACWHVNSTRSVDAARFLRSGLVLMAIVGFCGPVTIGGTAYDLVKRCYFVMALVVLGAWSRLDEQRRRLAVSGLLGAFAIVHVAGPILVPDPVIDNWAWAQACLDALLRGVHPYSLRSADILRGIEYGGGTASVYPYPPMTLLALAPGFALFGDYRVTPALAMPLVVLMIRAIGRRLAVPAAQADGATLSVLLFPRTFWVSCFGYVEPVMAVALLGFTYLAICRRAPIGQALCFWMVPALKQYIVAPAILVVALRRHMTRSLLVVSGLAVAAVAAPFFLSNWTATWQGVFREIAEQPFPRADSTSFAGLAVRVGFPYPSRYLAPVLQLAVGALSGWRLRDAGLGGLLLASAVSLLATFLVGWQAFVNYYWLVCLVLVVGALCVGAGRSPSGWSGPEY